jgi:hypothetical protein
MKGERVQARVRSVQKSLPDATGPAWWCDPAGFYARAKERLQAGLIKTGTARRVAGGEW